MIVEEDPVKRDGNEIIKNEEDRANPLSHLTLSWASGIIRKGFKNELEVKDLWEVSEKNRCRSVEPDMERYWDENQTIGKVVLKSSLSLDLVLSAIFFILWGIFLVIGPAVFLKNLLSFLELPAAERTKKEYQGWLWAAFFPVNQVLSSICMNKALQLTQTVGMRVRSGLMSMIFRKSLKLQNVDTIMGEITNHITNDSDRIFEGIMFIHFVWITWFVLFALFAFIFVEISYALFPGLGVIVLSIPLQMFFAGKLAGYRRQALFFTDKRVQRMNEIIVGIKLVKLYAWENSFADSVAGIRKKEIGELRKSVAFNAMNTVISVVPPVLAVFLSLITYFYTHPNGFKASTIFSTIALYQAIKFPLMMGFYGIMNFSNAKVAAQRIQSFMERPSLENHLSNKNIDNSSLVLENATFKQSGLLKTKGQETKQEKVFELTDVSFHLKKKSLLLVVGSVGAGKTTLLHSILGGLEKVKGKLEVNGSVAYTPQQAWIINGTLRDNITFGSEYDKERFDEVARVCGLVTDFELMPNGELTSIGENGVNLSGGQKQRVSLARSVYANKDILLLDDVLSAVDAKVGKEIFEECITEYLSDKIVVLVTHQLQYCSKASNILVLKEGQVAGLGSYDELIQNNDVFQDMMKSYLSNLEKQEEEKKEAKKIKKKLHVESTFNLGEQKIEKDEESIIEKEDNKQGTVGAMVWITYFLGFGAAVLVIIILFAFGNEAFRISIDFWISYWLNKKYKSLKSGDYVLIYGMLVIGFVISLVVKYVLFAIFSLRSSTRLHNRVFSRVLRATTRFFEANPTGRILNRFSKDMDIVDTKIPFSLQEFFFNLILVTGVFATVGIVFPWLLIAVPVMLIIFFIIGMFFRRAIRQIKRLESVYRSPIISHSQQSLNGLLSIRSFGQEARFALMNEQKVDEWVRTSYPFWVLSRWFALRLDVVSSLIVAGACLVAIGLKSNPALSGLAITYSLMMSTFFQWAIRNMVESENFMTSVERILHYSKEVPLEPPAILERRPPQNWPSEGKIEFNDVYVRYRPSLPPVLKNINFTINPREKVAIVGRTGAGKSSFCYTLFRMIDHEGSIKIDGINISEIGLYDLRSNLAIIPQDPVLFAGTVRSNLDPFDTYSDSELWDSLQKVELQGAIYKLNGRLDAPITDNGSNFSVGERQLICIARAILRKPKVLILDEATANVDTDTDNLIQRTIRKNFVNCTTITIAHRINTIIDCDRVIVMDKGQIVESGEPYKLLNETKKSFYSLVSETGETFTNHLKTLALDAKFRKQNNTFNVFQDEGDSNMWNEFIHSEIHLEMTEEDLEDTPTKKPSKKDTKKKDK